MKKSRRAAGNSVSNGPLSLERRLAIYAAVFLAGFSVMVVELLGSRILAPHLGTTIIVWTSVIGAILASLSLGYWLGGLLADLRPSPRGLAAVLLTSGLLIAITAFAKSPILGLLGEAMSGFRWRAVVASFALFGPANLVLGMIVPYAVRLSLKSVKGSGSQAGYIYALSTVGSLIGTYSLGFLLLVHFRTTTILLGLSLALVLVSLWVGAARAPVVSLLTVLALAALLLGLVPVPGAPSAVLSFESQYGAIEIVEEPDYLGNGPARLMKINGTYASAISLNSDRFAHGYLNFFRLAEHFAPRMERALMIGGAGCVFSQHLKRSLSSIELDIVEIDPVVTTLAERYFEFDPSVPGLTVYHEDGRTFLQRRSGEYDVIYRDAFNDNYTPFQLTTFEAAGQIFDALEEEGLAVFNVISSLDGPLLGSEIRTLRTRFPQVLAFPVYFPRDLSVTQNIIVVASKTSNTLSLSSADPEIQRMLDHRWKGPIDEETPVLTDEFAPVEYFALSIPRD